jgi:hypothetical protein
VAEEKTRREATPFEKFEKMARRVFPASKLKVEERKQDSNKTQQTIASKAKS